MKKFRSSIKAKDRKTQSLKIDKEAKE